MRKCKHKLKFFVFYDINSIKKIKINTNLLNDITLGSFVYDNKTWKNSPRIKNVQLLKIRVHPSIRCNRIIAPIILRWRVSLHALHFPSNNPTYHHRPTSMDVNPKTIMGPTTTSSGPYTHLSSTIPS